LLDVDAQEEDSNLAGQRHCSIHVDKSDLWTAETLDWSTAGTSWRSITRATNPLYQIPPCGNDNQATSQEDQNECQR
jgi:hypothetical protein